MPIKYGFVRIYRANYFFSFLSNNHVSNNSSCNQYCPYPILNRNRIAIAQQTLSSLTNEQRPTGISFQIDNTTFYIIVTQQTYIMALVNGVQIHYVIGGHGDPVILLHGWPDSSHEWRDVMALAKNH